MTLPPHPDHADRLRERLALLDDIEQQLECDVADAPALLELRATLERTNARVFDAIRAEIRAGRGRSALTEWLGIDWSPDAEVDTRDGYDHLDATLADVIEFDEPAPATVEPTAEMVFYQPTPVRHILDFLRRTALTADDVLVDLGAGLGLVGILTAICTDARAIGVELEPAYVDCARRAAANLQLERVSFVVADARDASLDEGTVFFLYTPFSGAMLRTVLDALRREAMRRPIRVCTFGPCTTTIAAEEWLIAAETPRSGRVTVFQSSESAR